MKPKVHTSADPSHYDQDAAQYDALNEENSAITNQTVENILKKHNAKTVLDLTCGTGSQVFWLTKRGYDVVGVDINNNMLEIAKQKAQKNNLDIQFIQGDMRTTKVGFFDAVITMFNAIGHLTKEDFEKAMQNIHNNLNDSGIYIFDIFNLNYFLQGDNITKLTIDWQKMDGDTKVRKIQFSTIDENGILASYTTSLIQPASAEPAITESSQSLQIYTLQQLKQILEDNNFNILEHFAIDGSEFIENKTERMVVVAQKAAN